MKFAILSLVAAGGLALSAGSASAQYYHGGYNHGHCQGGFYGVAPVVPVVPAYPVYSYPGYSSGFGLTIGGSRGVISIGSGSVYPSYGYGGYYAQPYYSGYGYGYGRRW
ncbi:MAG: hypothetical protein ACKODX_10890 [Gemmata sp.]